MTHLAPQLAGPAPPASPGLPGFREACRHAARIEYRAGGWLCNCQRRGLYQVLSRELVCAVRAVLTALSDGSVLEVAAGCGSFAAALSTPRLRVVATDSRSGWPADRALEAFRPGVVVSCFAPADSGVDAAVLACPTVRHYLVLNAACNGLFGSPALRQATGWSGRPVASVTGWMLTRFDTPLDPLGRRWVRHGQAWLFSRRALTAHVPLAT